MEERVCIVVNNVGKEDVYVINNIRKSDVLVSCDGAANVLKDMGIVPQVIVGDLDSLTAESRSFFKGKSKIIHKPSQYKCDLEKALDYCVENSFNTITLLGLDGGRADYAIANFIVLKHYCQQLNIKVIGKDYVAFPITDYWQKKCTVGQLLSFIPFGHCEGISLKGLKYELQDAVMKLGDIGVSNEVTHENVSINIKSGYACIFLFNKK